MPYTKVVQFVPVLCLILQGTHSSCKAQPSELYFEPGGPKEGLPQRALSVSYMRGWKVTFETPAILEVTDDPASGTWIGISVDGSYGFKPDDLGVPPRQYYRVLSAERPTKVYVPDSYDSSVPTPLVILLHGFTDTGQGLEDYVHILPMAEEYGFVYGYPDGTQNSNGHGFWNATGACCDFEHADVDDVGYLKGLIESVEGFVNIDPKRVFLIGYSNGAFMAHRMAQEHSDVVAAVACLAGTISEGDFSDPIGPVHVLQVHGTEDGIVHYDGGTALLNMGGGLVYQTDVLYVGAQALADWWGSANGCTGWIEDNEATLELSDSLGSPDTVVARWSEHPANGAVELWSIQGGGHWPEPSPEMWQLMVEWLLAHPKQ